MVSRASSRCLSFIVIMICARNMSTFGFIISCTRAPSVFPVKTTMSWNWMELSALDGPRGSSSSSPPAELLSAGAATRKGDM